MNRENDTLTASELEVLRDVANGLRQGEGRRGISTVKGQLAHARDKLGARTTAQAIAILYETDPTWRHG